MSLQTRYKKPKVKAQPLPLVDGQHWLSVRQAAAHIAGHVYFVRQLIKLKKIRKIKVGRGFAIDRYDLDRFMHEHKA
jgi:excisionase family DNA binding protein